MRSPRLNLAISCGCALALALLPTAAMSSGPAGGASGSGGSSAGATVDSANTVATSVTVGTPMDQPIGQITLPVESGALHSHADLQFGFARADLGMLGGVNVLSLALDAQYALWDRLEVGINVPFLIHGWAGGGLGQISGSDSAFGNLTLNLKGKLFGDSRGSYAVSIFANTTLPTTSADLNDRGFAFLHAGVAGSGRYGIVTFGGATGVFSLLSDNNAVLYNLDFFSAVRLHRMIAIQLAAQIGVPVEPSGGEVAFALTPAVQVTPMDHLHFDVGSRIGLTDAGKGYAGGGRASLVVSAGYNF